MNCSKSILGASCFKGALLDGSRCCVGTARLARVRRRQMLSPSKPSTTTTSGTNGRHFFSTTTRRCGDGGSAFRSPLDMDPVLVRAGQKHGPGLILLALIPITAFALGTWQVYRLRWKTDLLARLEDRIVRPPLPLPPHVDPDVAAEDFDHRRVRAVGRLRHDREMLVGPRVRDGQDGYLVITPLEREGGGASTILVNRGWISKRRRDQRTRRGGDALPRGDRVVVEGMIRAPWRRNWFTPENRPDRGEFFFPDVAEMARLTGAQPVWIEATMDPDYLELNDYEARGVPVGRPATVNINNNHGQYIFTWYALAAATSVMFYLVVKKPASNIARRLNTRIM